MVNSKCPEDRLRAILSAVSERIQQRIDSIDSVFKFGCTGIESWFKVEFASSVESIGEEVIRFQNKGPDVEFSNELFIELKAATDFNLSYIKNGALKYHVPCIFLGNGENPEKVERLKGISQIRVIGIDYLKGKHTWVVGCIVPTGEK